MKTLFFVACLIELVVQIELISKCKKTHDIKYWNIFKGIAAANFVSAVLASVILPSFELNSSALNNALACVAICGFSFVSNTIVLIVGLIVRKSTKFDGTKTSKDSFFSCLSVMLLNIFILLILPQIVSGVTLKIGEKRIVNYLNNRYGDGNYEVVNVSEEYGYDGIVTAYLTGYHYVIKCDFMDGPFVVDIDDGLRGICADYFLPVYYSEKNNLKHKMWYDGGGDFNEFDNYIEKIIDKQYPTEAESFRAYDVHKLYLNYVDYVGHHGIQYEPNYYIIPPNNGKIPTVQEIVDSLAEYDRSK